MKKFNYYFFFIILICLIFILYFICSTILPLLVLQLLGSFDSVFRNMYALVFDIFYLMKDNSFFSDNFSFIFCFSFDLFIYKLMIFLLFLKNNILIIYYFLKVGLSFFLNADLGNFLNISRYFSILFYICLFEFYIYYFDWYALDEAMGDEDFNEVFNFVNSIPEREVPYGIMYNFLNNGYIEFGLNQPLAQFDYFVPSIDLDSDFDEMSFFCEEEEHEYAVEPNVETVQDNEFSDYFRLSFWMSILSLLKFCRPSFLMDLLLFKRDPNIIINDLIFNFLYLPCFVFLFIKKLVFNFKCQSFFIFLIVILLFFFK